MRKQSAKAAYEYDAMFIATVSPNENGIITDFHHLHERENCWALANDHHELRQEIHESLGYEGERWMHLPTRFWDEAEVMYISARAGQAQLQYDEIMERRHADWAKYY
jgi:hypothetical protein